MSTTRNFRSTGLAITKNLCELSGGLVTAHSSLGEGSVFQFSIKLALPDPVIVKKEKCTLHNIWVTL
jgi:signal transduction histidine kinase